MTSRMRYRRVVKVAASIAGTALLAAGFSACEATAEPHAHADVPEAAEVAEVAEVAEHHSEPAKDSSSQVALHAAMRQLWVEHMEWTYATIAAFAADSEGLPATLDRLLQNQTDIGDAIEPFYGSDADAALTGLLEDHINGAVPILVAARDGDSKALKPAVTDWYRNAKEIADFLSAANPTWNKHDMRQMMKGHIDQTLAYATAQLQGDYTTSINAYGTAEKHMLQMADMLSDGLIAQFPDEFDD